MPLEPNKPKFKTDLQTDIAGDVKTKLQELIPITTKKAFYDAMKKFRDESKKQVGNTGIDIFDTANEQASLVFSEEMKNLSENISVAVSAAVSESVSKRVTEYLKKATIYYSLPPGTVTIGAGAAAVPNPVPIPLKFDPLNPLNNGGIE